MAGSPSRTAAARIANLLGILQAEGEKIGITAADVQRLSGEIDQCRRLTETLARQTPELQMLQQLLDLANGMVKDQDDRILRWTGGCQRLYGYTAEEAQGQHCYELLQTQFPQPLEEIKAALFQTDRWEGRLVQRRRDGQQIIVASQWVLHRDPDGRPAAVLEVNTDITERKQAEEQLRVSEARYRFLMESVPALVWSLDPETHEFDCNRQWHEYTGMTSEQARGMGWVQTIHPDDRQRSVESRNRALATGRAAETEHRLLRASDGSYRWFITRAMPMEDASGRVISWVGASVDIEELKQAQEALRETDRKLSSVLERMSDGLVTLDRQWRYTYVNAAAATLLGATAAELLGHTIWEMFPETLRLGVYEQFTRCLEQNVSVQFEVPCRDRWYESRCHPGPDGLAVFFEDVTDRRRAEAALRQSEQQFRQFADSIPQLAWTARPDGFLDYFNGRVHLYQGFVRHPDGLWLWRMAIHPDDIEHTVEVWQHALEVGEADQVEHRLHMADGTWRWHLTRAIPLRDEQGHVRKWFGAGTDIEEYKQAAAALAAAKRAAEGAQAAAERANQAKDQFLAILSHELRTPLTPVLATAQMMEMDERLLPEQHEAVEMVRRNVELEARLIDDLLDLTRIARGKLELHLQPVDVHDKLRHVVQMVNDDVAAKQIQLVVQPQATHHHVLADSARLQQVLWNLLVNAVKFTPTGGRITLRTRDVEGVLAGEGPAGQIAISVEDTGIGIVPDMLPRLFSAFEQGGRETTRQFGGLGLGLAISRNIVEMHGGTLRAYSEGTGKGATFTVQMPTTTPTPHEALPKGSEQARPARASGRLLLVEDHPDTSRMLARLLRHLGFEVRTADSVASAIVSAEAQPFDLLISDLGLPDGNGLDLMRHLSAHLPGPVKAIALSGFGMDEDIARSREVGFAEHLTKPVDLAQLRAAIARIMADPR